MDAQAWNGSSDPMVMLDVLRGVASERKLRLFSFALCQRLHFTPDSVEDGQAFLARAEQLFDAPRRPPGSVGASAAPAARADLCRMLREVFGYPFAPLAIDPDWLTWIHHA